MHLPFKSLVCALAATLALVNVSLPTRAKAQTCESACKSDPLGWVMII